ncbi:MAG: signal peptidase II [Alphaproteobacteria bacterium]|nr:signal peptidase II [Alphaproteobacteria bacterium]
MIYIVALIVFLADIWTKHLALAHLAWHQPVPVIPGFDWYLTQNTGIGFSLFNTAGPYVLSAAAMLICAGVIVWLKHERHRWTRLGLALVLGGAAGNVVDRLRFGYVVDFIDWHAGPYHWPAFNVADAAVCLGVACILVQSVIVERKKCKKSF